MNGPSSADMTCCAVRLFERATHAFNTRRRKVRSPQPTTRVTPSTPRGTTSFIQSCSRNWRIVSMAILSQYRHGAPRGSCRTAGAPAPARRGTPARHLYVRLLTLAVSCALASTLLCAADAGNLYKQGKKAEEAGRMAEAYLLYSQAAAAEPNNQLYWLKSQALRTRALLEVKSMPPPAGAAAAQPSEPSTEARIPEADAKELQEAAKPLPPKQLTGSPGLRDLDFRGDSKALFESVAKAYGLDCIFDGDFQPTQPIRFRLEGADYRDALHALEAATGSFIVPISERLFLVAKDTPQKRAEVEPAVSVTIKLPEPASTQDFTALITAVQQTMGIQKVSWNTQQNAVVMRDTISKVLAARQLFEDLLYPRAQVVIDVELMEINRSQSIVLGISLANSFPIVPLGNWMGHVPSIPAGLSRLALFGGGASLMGLGIISPTIVATLNRSDGKLLMHTEMRSIDGQAAQLHVGDRYPILTGGYYGPSSFSGPNANAPPPQFTLEDLGLKVKATPRVHGMESVTIELEAEFRLLTGESFNAIPVIANRQLKSTVRLETGEWAVIAGLMETNEARTIAGIYGLSSVPYLGPLFSQHHRDRSSSNVLVLMRPRIVSLPPDQNVTHTFRIGSETRPLTPL